MNTMWYSYIDIYINEDKLVLAMKLLWLNKLKANDMILEEAYQKEKMKLLKTDK